MKRGKSRVLSFLMALLVTVTSVFSNVGLVWAAESSSTVLASWNYTAKPENMNEIPNNGGDKDLSSGVLKPIDVNPKGYSSNGLTFDGWDKDTSALIIEVPDIKNASSIYLNMKVRASATCTKDLKVEYKFYGEEDWKEIGTTNALTTTLTQQPQFVIDGVQGKAQLSIRLSSKSKISSKEVAIANGGTCTINNIVISTTAQEQKQTCAAPKATPAAGEVENGTEVSLSTTTDGATIYYNIDGSSNYLVYSTPIKITQNVDIKCYAKKDGFENSATKTFSFKLKEAQVPGGDEEETPVVPSKIGTKASDIEDGDMFVLYNASAKGVVSNVTTSKGFKAVEVTPTEDGKIEIPENALVLVAYKDKDGNYTFVSDKKYLTSGATGNALSLADSESDYSLWTVEKADSCVYIMNVNAKFKEKQQGIEFFSGNFTTFSFDKGSSFELVPYVIKKNVKEYKTDNSISQIVAQWAGNANYEEGSVDKKVWGDYLSTNDLKDKNSIFTAVVNGKEVQPYKKSTSSSTGSTSYYMGGDGIGSGTNDYFQFKTSSVGMANMALSFRLRSTNAGAGSFTLQYSTDGVNFENFTDGSFKYAYTAYSSNGTSSDVSKAGEIKDGIAKTSLAPTYYISFNFEVPSGAANAEELYIRLVPGKEAAKSGSNLSSSGNTRVDSVVLEGHPIVDENVCGFVSSNKPAGGIPVGSTITLSSPTEGASIFYSVNGSEYKLYEGDFVLDELPAVITAYATKDGLKKSAIAKYAYEQEKCSNALISPNGGAILKSKKVGITTNTLDAKILYAFVESKDSVVADNEWVEYTEKFTIPSFPTVVKAKVVKDGCIDSAISTAAFTEKSNEAYGIYFGQIHAHTNYSDGAGSCEEAFQYASKVDNLDYIAITDHSNSFDNEKESCIAGNKTESNEWVQGHDLAKKYTTDKFTCLYGYEMTWSNGLGHMNTFNTAGFQSRTQTEYSTYSTALQNYYAALNTVTDSISMFNHPGTTFGDFSDFAYFTEENDALINLIEVGNGEGVIGSSGYFPSYEYYTRALDKGWHVAPTNNQDNHKGKWGDANTGRTVVLADGNNEEAIYDAMRNHRIYATEDNDLRIYYTLDGNVMGTVLTKDEVGETVSLKVDLKDADNEAIGKVQVIVNGGLSIAEKTVKTNEEVVSFEVPSSYSYYYIKVVEADGDIAVTAPVWVGEVEACGINSTETETVLPIQGEDLDINIDLYNNEKISLDIDTVTITLNDKVIFEKTGAELGVASIAPNSTGKISWSYRYSGVGAVSYNIVVKAKLGGVEKVYNDVLKVNYAAPQMIANVIIDGTHYNDYVSGYYGGNMGNFIALAGQKNVKAVVETEKITAEKLENCALLIVSAPAKKNGTANAGDYKVSHFEPEFLETVANYVAKGGNVIVCGLADYSDTKDCQASVELNKLLSAIGSTIRINSDEVYDEVNNGGQPYRMYPTVVNKDSVFLAGVKEGQKYSQYSGCSVDITNAVENDAVFAAQALVKGFDTTYSIDCKDEKGASAGNAKLDNMGQIVFLAHQETKAGGNIFAAGGVFISDFEVSAEMDNPDSLPYINYTIAQNILTSIEVELPVTNIIDVRHAALGEIFAVEGYVTNGTDNEFTTFFDSIYIQDATGGIDIFPYAQSGLAIGTKIRVVGYVDEYQGDRELQVLSTKILEDAPVVIKPLELNTKDSMNYDVYGGRLLKTTGVVTRIEKTADGLGISEFWIMDESGKEASIFIDGYIYSGTTGKNELASFVKVGAKVSAVGVLYMHPEGDSDVSVPVFRVRNCDEIVLIEEAKEEVVTPTPVVPTEDEKKDDDKVDDKKPAKPSKTDKPSKPSNQTKPDKDASKEDTNKEDTNKEDTNEDDSAPTINVDDQEAPDVPETPVEDEQTDSIVESVTNPTDTEESTPSNDTVEAEKNESAEESKKPVEEKKDSSKKVVAIAVTCGAAVVVGGGAGSVLFVRRRGIHVKKNNR